MHQSLTADDVLDALLVIAERSPSPAVHDAVAIAPLRAALLYDKHPHASAMALKRVGGDIGDVLSWSQLDERDGVQRPIVGVLVRPSSGNTLNELTKRLAIGYAAAATRPSVADQPEALPAGNGDSHPAGQPGDTTEDSQ